MCRYLHNWFFSHMGELKDILSKGQPGYCIQLLLLQPRTQTFMPHQSPVLRHMPLYGINQNLESHTYQWMLKNCTGNAGRRAPSTSYHEGIFNLGGRGVERRTVRKTTILVRCTFRVCSDSNCRQTDRPGFAIRASPRFSILTTSSWYRYCRKYQGIPTTMAADAAADTTFWAS